MNSRMISTTAILFVALFSTPASSQVKPNTRPVPAAAPVPPTPIVDDLTAARNATDTFLKGVKIADLPEGKEMLLGVQWITGEADFGQNFYERPKYTVATTVFEKLFDTDTPGVQGYKRLLDMNAVSKAGTPLIVRYIVIAYKDQHTNQWKVLGTDTDDGVDIDRQVAFFGQNLHDRTLSEQGSYLTYGEWLLRAGRIKEAREALTTALSSSTTSTEMVFGKPIDNGTYSDLHRLQINALLSVIDSITGVHKGVLSQPSSIAPC